MTASTDIAASRLRAVSVGVALLLPTIHLLHYVTQPALAAASLNPINRLVLLASVLLAGGVVALYASRAWAPSTLLRLGVALEIVVAFAVSLVETAAWHTPGHVGIGASAVGPWVLLMGTFVPSRSDRTLWAGMAASTAWPVAFGINAVRAGLPPLPPGSAWLWILLNYVWALVAFLISRVQQPSTPLSPTSDLLGGYRLVSRIGEGGMGEVWEATHRQLARMAAVKIIRPEMIAVVGRQTDTAIARFRREATLIARLQSPHTVYVYDFGVSDDGRFYYVMEFLDGISLQSLVQTFGPLSPSRVTRVLTQVCASLHEAHEQGLVHRDLKPSNVMLCTVALMHDVVKVLDFGLAKNVSDPSATQLTAFGTTAGTPGYMAPEAVLGETPVDRRADIYGLGCLAYYLLTGSLVFEEANLTRLALKHVHDEPDPPSTRAPHAVPPDLEQIVLQCLAKKPAHRPPTAAALAEQLSRCAVDVWSESDAARWWREHLPPGSPWRRATVSGERQPSGSPA